MQVYAPSVIYLGHKIDAEGLHPLPDKINAPSPRNVHELKSYLGLLSYYSKFMPNLATVLAPLYQLLRKDFRWRWTQTEKEAFKASKELLTHLIRCFGPLQPSAQIEPSL